MWYHRRNDPALAIHWSESSLRSSMKEESRLACVRLLLAMSLHQQGKAVEAAKLLTEAATPIHQMMSLPPQTAADKMDFFWVDWISAHVLLKEAEVLIGASATD